MNDADRTHPPDLPPTNPPPNERPFGIVPEIETVPPAPPVTSGLSKDVFLSYASPDQESAYRLCRMLEDRGIRCWIAPRDVTPGADYGQAIIQGIESTTATLLLLSDHANTSIHVAHEVERATSKRKWLIPIRLEDVQPGPSLELHLSATQWLDGWRLAPEQLADQLARALRGGEGAPSVGQSRQQRARRPARDRLLRGLVLALLLLAVLRVVWEGYVRLEAGRARIRRLEQLAHSLLAEGNGPEERRRHIREFGELAGGVPDGFATLEQELAPAEVESTARVPRARRQANAATALAALGRWELVAPLLRYPEDGDPTVRSYLIDRLASSGVEAETVIARLDVETDASARRALLLALGEFGRDRLPEARRQALLPRLTELYRDDADAGIHGAADWLLRQWGQQKKLKEIDTALTKRDENVAKKGNPPADGRRWYVNGQQQTMVFFPQPGVFRMGEGQERHSRRIGRDFALSAREVTVAEFRRSGVKHGHKKQHGDTDDCPVNGVSWNDAVEYCNWLSEMEGIPRDQWCYFRDGEDIRPVKDCLNRTGYRLPTEAEWEYACRAGSTTRWAHGEAEDLLEKYAVYGREVSAKTAPVGSLGPNDRGLFDMHGNVLEWCQDWYGGLRRSGGDGVIEDVADFEDRLANEANHVLRGGSFHKNAADVRSARRYQHGPAKREIDYGLRPARTILSLPSSRGSE
jgi:formylglycine-generating enzyme required for sulfatase activity